MILIHPVKPPPMVNVEDVMWLNDGNIQLAFQFDNNPLCDLFH